MRDDRPGMGERYGVAVNASTLELEPGRETALDRVCEMGFARIEMSLAAAGEGERVASELAPWLWRAAYGKARGTSLSMACTLFTQWLLLKPYMAEVDRVDAGIARRFAECLLQEWLSLRCTGCGGGGWQGVTATGKRVHASVLGRNAAKAICLQCRGNGKPKESPQMRMRVLGSKERKVSVAEYEKLWRRQFIFGLVALKKISERPRDHLHAARNQV